MYKVCGGSWWLEQRSCLYFLNAVYQESAFAEGLQGERLLVPVNTDWAQGLAASTNNVWDPNSLSQRILAVLLQLARLPLRLQLHHN